MSKININKTNDIGATRPTDRNPVKDPKNDAARVEKTADPTKDQISFSGRSAEVGKLVDQIKNLPDERKGLVHQFKTEILANQYKPSSTDIADAIIESGD
ncbi:MAG: flagellar biosynthesis anti-sigma factor FlgM [Pyrinomonadaceae bacterium]|nr:flagellar biosynthesis anti-sigma factor FlgM [Pyrinomonadaceae bacterium]